MKTQAPTVGDWLDVSRRLVAVEMPQPRRLACTVRVQAQEQESALHTTTVKPSVRLCFPRVDRPRIRKVYENAIVATNNCNLGTAHLSHLMRWSCRTRLRILGTQYRCDRLLLNCGATNRKCAANIQPVIPFKRRVGLLSVKSFAMRFGTRTGRCSRLSVYPF